MPDLGTISNQLRQLADRTSFLAAEAVDEAQAQIAQVYADLGYSASLIFGRVGILIGSIQTNILEILGNSAVPQFRIRATDDQSGDVLIQMNEALVKGIATGADGNPVNPMNLRIGPGKFQIEGPDGFVFQLESAGSAGGPYITQLSLIDPISGNFLTMSPTSIIGAGIGQATFAVPSSTLTPLTITFADVPGLNVTLDRDGLWEIEAVVEMNFQAAAGGVLAQLVLGATPQTRIFRFLSAADFAGVSSQKWYVTNAGTNVAKIQAKASVASGTRQVVAANTILSAKFLHP